MGTFAETSIVDYHLSFAGTKENKLLFSVSVCSKQTEVCHFRFPFAENKQKLPFSVSSAVCGIPETRRHGGRDIEAWRYGNGVMETWRNGDMGTVRYEGSNSVSVRYHTVHHGYLTE
jgi:hypothetical protein